jgi:hypothetical protein
LDLLQPFQKMLSSLAAHENPQDTDNFLVIVYESCLKFW